MVVADKAPVVEDKVLVVADKHKADVVKLSNVVADKPINVVVADNVDVGKALVKDKVGVYVLKGSLSVDVVSDNVQDDLAKVVKENVLVVVNDKASDALKNKSVDVKETSDEKGKKSVVGKDKGLSDILKYKPKNNAPEIVKERRKTELPKDKPKNNAPEVVTKRRKTELPKEKTKINSLEVVKERRKIELPKDNPKNKPKAHSEVLVAEKSTVVSDKSKRNPKQKFILTVQALSKVSGLRSSKQKVKPKVKSKAVVRVLRSKETPVKSKWILSKEERKGKKLKITAALKRKGNCLYSSDSSSIDEENIKRLLNKLKKKFKKEEFDEESVPKKGKKKQKQLTPAEAAHEEYLLSFPTLRVRTSPSSLFSAIRDSRVDMLNFLSEIGFSSLQNVTIDKIPSKLGRFVVANFNEQTYILSLDSGDKIEVTHRKIHEILGVPICGYSLFDLEEREVDHEFVRLWVGQFYPKPLKDIRVNDIASKLVVAQEIDFLFKVNFLTLFTNPMGYIYDYLQYSKLPLGTNHYLGPLTFLVLLYLDSTKFDRFPVVRTRPSIKNWSSYLMKQRQELELKDHVLGLLELHGEWTGLKLRAKKLKGLRVIRKLLRKRKASLEYPVDGIKFLDLHEKYVQFFKNPISFNVDGNKDNDGDDNGDDDADDGDGNGDNDGDDDADDGDGNGDDEDGNLDDDGDQNGMPTEEYEIMSTPESYTQWLERNADLVREIIDCIPDEYLYSDLFGQNLVTTKVLNQGPPTPDRMPTRASKTKSMFDGTLTSHNDKWESFSNQVKAQFKGNEGGLALEGIDLKKMFAHNLKLYGHNMHALVARLKHKIPKLKWSTKGNFHDCGIFTMLHMESSNGGTTANWDCGLPVELQL
ncbi:hypothetical protein Tco_0535117 [Tanacetum coccineum]